MNKYKVDYEMIVGEGMFHCYPFFPICKEAKDGWNMMVRLMREDETSEDRQGFLASRKRLPENVGESS